MPTMAGILLWALFFFFLYFEVLLLILFIEHTHNHNIGAHTPKLTHYPTVEIVVPCFNEESTIVDTVNSLLNLSYPRDKFRIHVVNDGSTDSTKERLQQYTNHPQVRVSHKENGGKHTALNYAIKTTQADVIGCLDADSFVETDALTESMKVFAYTKAMAVTPAIKVAQPQTILGHMQKAEYEIGIAFRRLFADIHAQFITPGPFSLYRKEVFETLGLFKSAHNTEDLEMGLRMQSAQYLIENAPKAVVHTKAPQHFYLLFKQRVRWAYGFLRNTPDYRHLFFNPRNFFLGYILLPITFVSIFAAAYIPFSIIRDLATLGIQKYVEYQTVGLQAFAFNLGTIDWYTFIPSTLTYVIVALILATMVLILVGRHLVGESLKPDRGMLLYLVLYGFVAPIWLTKAVFDAVVVRNNRWR